MKKYRYRYILPALAVFLALHLPSRGQTVQTGERFNLTARETGNKTYIARDTIRLSERFSYTGSKGNSFRGKIDPTLVFWPSEHLYMDGNGNFTDNPTQGAAVGSLAGQINVMPTGAAVYTIPIGCPPGLNDMQPSISLIYNSQSGNGIAGMCWHLGGLSMISRVPQNHHYNTDRSNIIWDESSPLALDGQRLFFIRENGLDKHYRTETTLDSIVCTEVRSSTGAFQTYSYFKVYQGDGRILTYGKGGDTPLRMPLTIP